MTAVRVVWRDRADELLRAALGTGYGVKGFTPFRGRDLAGASAVEVYRNLNEERRYQRVRWSIRDADTGLVLGHADKLAIGSAVVHVNVAAQQRIAEGGPRTVHAWVTGRLEFCPTDDSPWYGHARRVTYHPHQPNAAFHYADTGAPFCGTTLPSGLIRLVRFDQHGMWAW